jgi:hypothetical protein
MPMQTIATLRISTVALVLGALVLPCAHAAEEPQPINIPAANLKSGLTETDVAQIKLHVEYWLSEIAGAKSAGHIYAAREGLVADYNKFASSDPYKMEFARTTGGLIEATLLKLDTNDRLVSLKEMNIAISVSEMSQLKTVAALDILIAHRNPGVRFLGWRGYRAIRDDAIRAGKASSEPIFTALEKHAAGVSSPLVAGVMVDIMSIDKSALLTSAFRKAFDRNFKALLVLLKPCYARLAAGDARWAAPCYAAISMLINASEFYKPDPKMARTILQQLVNMAQAGAKAYAHAEGAGPAAFKCSPMLLRVEPILGELSNNTNRDIRKPLINKKMGAAEKATAVRLAVLDWIERLEELGIKKPVFTPAKAPAPTTQPTTKPAA